MCRVRFADVGCRSSAVKVGDDSDTVRATWFNQPWVAAEADAGDPDCCSPGRRASGGSGWRNTSSLPARGSCRRRPACPFIRRPRGCGRSRMREWVEQAIGVGAKPDRGAAGGGADAARARRGRRCGQGDALPRGGRGSGEWRGSGCAFEELFLYQAILATRKRSHRTARPAPRLGKPGEQVGRWIESLPFEPTAGPAQGFRRDRRGPRLRRADAAAADGGGRVAARPWSPCTRCCGRWKPGSRRC